MQFFTLKTRSLPTLSKGWLGAMFPIVKHQCEHCEHLSSTNPEGNCPKSTITAITAHDSNTTPTWIITYWLINRRLVSVFFARLKKMELVWWQVNTLKFPNNPIWKLLKNPTSRDVCYFMNSVTEKVKLRNIRSKHVSCDNFLESL